MFACWWAYRHFLSKMSSGLHGEVLVDSTEVQMDQMEAMEIQMKRRLLDLKKRYQQKQHELNKLQQKNRCVQHDNSIPGLRKCCMKIRKRDLKSNTFCVNTSTKVKKSKEVDIKIVKGGPNSGMERIPSPSLEDDPHSLGSKKRKHKKPQKVNLHHSEVPFNILPEFIEELDQINVPPMLEMPSVKLNGKDLVDGMKILMYQEGNVFSAGTLTQIHPPDLYGVLVNGDRHKNRPIILCQEEVTVNCVLEKTLPNIICVNTRIAAYWSGKMHCLYPGNIVSEIFAGQVHVDFDDGDSAFIPVSQIRLLPNDFAPSLKRTQRSLHKVIDGGLPIKGTKDIEITSIKRNVCDQELKQWNWFGASCQNDDHNLKTKKVFYKSIVKQHEVINCGDCVVFLSSGRPNLPYIGLIESMWESWAKTMVVQVRWFYHPEEMLGKEKPHNKNALYKSTHIDDNDVQTISHICYVLSYEEYKKRRKLDQEHMYYYCAGTYDPLSGVVTHNTEECT